MRFKFLNLNLILKSELKKLFTYLSILHISIVFSCHQPIKYVGKKSSLNIDSTTVEHLATQELIAPYKTKLDEEMNEVLVISAEEFPKERGKTETKLGNLVADLSIEITKDYYKDDVDFCLLNFGGLRTSLPKGDITRGKIFELMPFENELVVLELDGKAYDKIIKYLISSPQPISGNLSVKQTKNPNDRSLKIDNVYYNIAKSYRDNGNIKILTTDYLASGGDKMVFFANPIKYEKVGIKLRDAIIKYCIQQHKEGKQLTGKLDGRISFE